MGKNNEYPDKLRILQKLIKDNSSELASIILLYHDKRYDGKVAGKRIAKKMEFLLSQTLALIEGKKSNEGVDKELFENFKRFIK